MVTTVAALDAALGAARGVGLPTAQPVVLRDLTNVLVHLAPAPVVARVPLTLARLRGPDWFAQELRVATFLAEAGAPIAPPADAVDPGPHEQDGLLVSFWRHVDHDPARADPVAAGRSLRDLHAALASFPEPLPALRAPGRGRRLLGLLQPSAAASETELAALGEAHERLAKAHLPEGRPLHGDAHLGNVLWTPSGPLWADLENACAGPIEWDLACITWRNAPGTPEAIAAYGPHDQELIDAAEPLLALFLAAWTIVVAERAPSDEAVAEAHRRIERAVGYALEM